MYLKEINLAGFKSYAERTVVPDFDPHFNAITGLNGTGKSNILDSICFVFGLTKLNTVRASSLQDLVYQQGCAGIRKATVSLVFDNSDESKSPRGYEECPQLTITREVALPGKNTYLVNGKKTDHRKIEELFQSVGININNPHFLIMQGRIMQILSMKPAEILAMVEEAAGTRIYDTRRTKAIIKLAKNETKRREIDKLVSEELTPKLKEQKKARHNLQEYENLLSSLDGLERFCVAYDFDKCQRTVQQCEDEGQEVQRLLIELDNRKVDTQAKIPAIDAELQNITREKQRRGGQDLKDAANAVHVLDKKLVEERTALRNHKKMKETEECDLKQIQSELDALSEEALERKVAAAKEFHDQMQNSKKELLESIKADEGDLAGAELGNPRDEAGRTLTERLALTKTQEIRGLGDVEAARIHAQNLEKDLANFQRDLQSRQHEATGQENQIQGARNEVENLKSQLQGLGFNPDEKERLESFIEEETSNVRRLTYEFNQKSQSSGLDFQFQDPYPGFDRGRCVKGVLAKLFTVNDPNYTVAVEVAIGGRLRNVVVDTSDTSSKLINRGQLKRRTTFIPLDSIRGGGIDQHAREAVHRLVGNDAVPAIDLISFPPELEPAMKFACGNTFICKDTEMGLKLSGSLKRLRFVTLGGQDYSSDGTLSDGYRDPQAMILKGVQELQSVEQNLREKTAALSNARQQLGNMQPMAQEHARVSALVDQKAHNLQLLEDHLGRSSFRKDVEKAKKTEENLNSAKEALDVAMQKVSQIKEQQLDLQRKIDGFGSNPDQFIKETRDRLERRREEIKSIELEAKNAEVAYKTAIAEKSGVEEDRERIKAKRDEAQNSLNGIAVEIERVMKIVAECEKRHREEEAKLKKKQNALVECDDRVRHLTKQKDELEKQQADLNNEEYKTRDRLQQIEGQKQKCWNRRDQLLKEFPWINSQMSDFGKVGTEFDWISNDPEDAQKEFESKKNEVQELKMVVNKNAIDEYETTRDELKKLTNRRQRLEENKKKIDLSIEILDERKVRELEETWKKVKVKMGEIFEILLPGATATVEPLPNEPLSRGLEVKVAISGQWKDSLSELSGGQRSLCALSFILAMLVFDPAPIYILDEVDSALDMSHTQNIGAMIRRFFPQSQFVVVSLKEGMFSNANVIFRTQLKNGKSGVTRTVSKSRHMDLPGSSNEGIVD
ncbi:hypothetical protein BSKO_08350 [Bryopsis sp. KO-2023]|nr:hypothetical protein BSKO_08350 [Bryopsis sp. KO-2023]